MIKDLILKMERKITRDSVRDYGISIANTFGAHLSGVVFSDSPHIPDYMMLDLPASVLQNILAENEKSARAAIERLDAAVKGSLLSVERRLITRNNLGTPAAFSSMARRYDLSVVMQSDDDSGIDNSILIEAALFDSGRPVVVVPYTQKGGVDISRVVCCWDGGSAASRAINDALPFLKMAGAVELFIVVNEKMDGDKSVSGVEMKNHLARHDIKVDIITTPADDVDVTNVILSHVADCSAGMIVMGGYGHSRLREFVLGGVTRGMLSSMTVPVFMSH